ncbi:aldose 1-epimerase [Hypericibacter adhaerens]|uniref:Aldose 1-epimerase n=1 Tax=Hypericibacter adhaerens TaxID=2602016 RepID=A0A5J6MW56_9PROT|nr:aldose epimerase family protein [Hypericibacter adhaerens]QEX21347.1 aldose 1-epimerase [Hypericibacter adhaerens]
MAVTRDIFGRIDGEAVSRFTLTNRAGLAARFIGYGATLTELHLPDRQGRMADVVLGFDRIEDYRASDAYMGATCGRYGNRIQAGRFSLDSRPYALSLNEGRNHAHGGLRGFDKRIWSGEPGTDGNSVIFTLRSPDGEEGYPGTLDARVSFALTDANELTIEMTAHSDRPTIANLVHHSYFNLAGHGSGDVLRQELRIAAAGYTPVDRELIPTGEILPVAGTAFDFSAFKPIGRDIERVPYPFGHAPNAGGYDHNLVLAGAAGTMRPVLQARDPVSGRAFDLATTEPGLQFYTGAELNDAVPGKGGARYGRYGGFALETQKFPNSPNVPSFPQARLDPGETYQHGMRFRFHTV